MPLVKGSKLLSNVCIFLNANFDVSLKNIWLSNQLQTILLLILYLIVLTLVSLVLQLQSCIFVGYKTNLELTKIGGPRSC